MCVSVVSYIIFWSRNCVNLVEIRMSAKADFQQRITGFIRLSEIMVVVQLKCLNMASNRGVYRPLTFTFKLIKPNKRMEQQAKLSLTILTDRFEEDNQIKFNMKLNFFCRQSIHLKMTF